MELAVELEKRPLKSAQTAALLVIAPNILWVMCAGYTDLRCIARRAKAQDICPWTKFCAG